MDELKSNPRSQDGKGKPKAQATTWGPIKNFYLGVEQPRARRYSFVASIELTDVESERHINLRTSNLSLFGCHVDSGTLLPAGIHVRIRIVHRGSSFVALGKIVYASTQGGMGVAFAEIDPNHQLVLENWIAQLRNPRVPAKS